MRLQGKMDEVYEVAVLGAGIMGSATAYYLVSRGIRPVLLLEQFDALHTRGSSHGGSRYTRRAYEKKHYVPMLRDSFSMWKEIEKKSGEQIYIKTGILVFGEASSEPVQQYIDTVRECGVPHEVFTGREANRRYPDQLKLPDSYKCVYEYEAGILRANKAVTTLQSLFVSHGGVLRDNHRVTRIIPGAVVTVETDKTSFRAKRIIVTAGAWTNKLLQHTGLTLPLRVLRSESTYWKVKNPQDFSHKSFPVFLAYDPHGYYWYGTSILEYPGLIKACAHGGPEVDPDNRDEQPSSVLVSKAREVIVQYFRNVLDRPAVLEYCLITMTPDRDSVIDRHPDHSNIVIGAGFSGHGFKEAPVVGKILSELALGSTPSYDLTHFRIDRFKTDQYKKALL